MQIIYLDSSVEDLIWFRHYYKMIFPSGDENARRQVRSIEQLLLDNPDIGHPTHRRDIREFSIPKTPFSFIYRHKSEVIEIIRVWDERQDRKELK